MNSPANSQMSGGKNKREMKAIEKEARAAEATVKDNALQFDEEEKQEERAELPPTTSGEKLKVTSAKFLQDIIKQGGDIT